MPHSTDLAVAIDPTEATLRLWETYADEGAELDEWEKAPATRRGYASDWRQFAQWCNDHGLTVPIGGQLIEPVTPADVLSYLVARQAELKSATITRHLAAIRFVHHKALLPSPTDHPKVSQRLRALKRKHAYRPHQATPLGIDELRPIVAGLDDSMKATRDRAMLLLGYWAALRRSELAALTVADLDDDPRGMIVWVRKSKTDQEAAGHSIAVHYRNDPALCAVRAVRAWIALAGITEGPIFRKVDRWGHVGSALSGQALSIVVVERVASIGLRADRYSAHSLRAGHVSDADRRRIPNSAVRATTRHKNDAMLSHYARPGDLFEHSSGAYFQE